MSSGASGLVYTSIEDMKTSLDCAEHNDRRYSIAILQQALNMSIKMGEKTRAKILQARIKRYIRESTKDE